MEWKKSGNYSAEDMMAMQKDAVERVREMQRRSDERLRQSNAEMPRFTQHKHAQSAKTSHPCPSDRASEHPACCPAPTSDGGQSPCPAGKIGEALAALGMDQDCVLLFSVLLILYNDGADPTLLMAVIYLLL